MATKAEQFAKQQDALQKAWVDINKYNAAIASWASSADALKAAWYTWQKAATPTTTPTTPTKTTTSTTTTSNQNTWLNSMSSQVAQNNSRNFQVWTWDVAEMPQQPKAQPIQTSNDRLAKAWQGLDYDTQQKKLNAMAWLKDALAQRGITSKTQPTTQTTKPTTQKTTQPQTPKQEQWDYQDNSQARMDQIANNLNGYRQTMPQLFDDMSAFYNFFIKDKGRSQDQIDFLWDYFNRVQKYGKYDNLSPDALWTWIANWDIPEDYLNTLKSTDPQKYQEVMAAKQNREDTIKNESFLNDAATMAWIEWWESANVYPRQIEWGREQWLWVDEDENRVDDRRENYASEEEQWYQKQIADLNAANLDIDNTVKHDYEDLVKKYPWATKATLMAMANDRNANLLREKENNLVELTRLQGYVWYMQEERFEMNKAWADSIAQLQKNLWMYYDYSPEWMAELAQAKYAATNITLDQADSWNETQKQMALQNVLDWYYDKYWDIIQRSEQQVINDVIAYSKKNWVWLAQALQENFVKYLKEKPEYQQMQAILSEPNLQTIWYNSDGKAVYWYWDSATKTFQPVTVWAGGITTWWATWWNAWVWASYTTNTEPLNNFITNLEANYTIASNWWTWGSKIRSWWCWTVCNDYLKSIWDSYSYWDSKQSKLDSITPWAWPAVWAIAVWNKTWTEDWDKYWHVAIVTNVDDANGKITVLESNKWTWLRYKTYNMSWVTGYYIPEWIKTNEYSKKENSNAFTKAWDIVASWIEWQGNKEMFKETLQWLLNEWDYTWAFEYITVTWKNNAKSDARDKIQAAETAMVDLISIKDALEAYYAAWWDTGILQWSLEKVANKLWKTTDPKLVWLATKISEAIQSYRKNISWTAFSEKEAKDYEALFPTIAAWQEYNNAKLTSTLDSMVIRLNQLYGWLIWPRTYINVLDAHEKATWNRYSMYEQQSQLYNYLSNNWYLNPDWSVKTAQDFATYMQSKNQRKGKRF